MVSKNSISIFVSTFLIIGMLFLALPENGYSGASMNGVKCCQYVSTEDDQDICIDVSSGEPCFTMKFADLVGEFEGESCNDNTGLCIDPVVNTPIPTLSEWGLIAMAGILGLVGFMVIRRRKVRA